MTTKKISTSTANRPARPANSDELPAWMKKLARKFGDAQAHGFILTWNVRDYATGTTPLVQYLFEKMASKSVVLRYNLSEGIQFSDPNMRKEFDRYTGFGQPSAGGDAGADVLRNLGLGGNVAAGPTGPQPLPTSPSEALPLLETLLRKACEEENGTITGQACVILEFAETICPNAEIAMMSPSDRTTLVTLERLAADPQIAETGNIIILVTEQATSLHPDLRRAASKYEIIEISLPDADQRGQYAQAQINARNLTLEEGLTIKEVANLTAMLNYVQIEDVCLTAAPTGIVTRQLILERKDEIIQAEFGEVITVLDPKYSMADIGDLQWVKDFFAKRVIKPIRENNLQRVPMGVLETGPAGCGKTIMAHAVAKDSGMRCVELNLAKLFGGIVGATERNWERARKAIESMAPVLVFIDEIDQALSRGQGGDSGVSNRLFKGWLEFLSDTSHRGKIVIIAASNRPDMMDAALRRPGRFDYKIPFFPPDDAGRKSITQVACRRHGLGENVEIPDALVVATNGYTGAELDALAMKAVQLVEDESLTVDVALSEALKRLRPSTSDIEFMTMLALAEVNDTDLLPPRYAAMLADRKSIEQKIETLAPRGRGASRREL